MTDTIEAGAGGEGSTTAKQLAVEVESGPRDPKSRFTTGVIVALCLVWSLFQVYIAYQPINAIIARSWHLGFAITLVFLAYPLYRESRPPFWLGWIRRLFPNFGLLRSNREYVPIYDWLFAAIAACGALYIWFDYEDIITRERIL